MNRREFVRNTGVLITGSSIGFNGFDYLAKMDLIKLTILHTNDTHSRLDPFPQDGSRYSGLGGASQRASVIERIRREEKNVLLFDAGDILQGTPYFNLYEGEPEILVMNEMRYDGSAIGNHDFDAGIERLAELDEMAVFPFLCCNYDFTGTPMDGRTLAHKIFSVDGLRIGLTGLGIELDGLVPEALHAGTKYLDPVASVNVQARYLKEEADCDYVICLSHLGYEYGSEKVSDIILAAESEHVDLIIGGHTHTFLEHPVALRNKNGNPILVTQVGWAGIVLGRIDIYFERSGRKVCEDCRNTWVKELSIAK